MKEYKLSILWTGSICMVSLPASILFNYFFHSMCFGIDTNFLSSLFLGVFTSGLLAFIISVIGYKVERIRTLEGFYTYARKSKYNFNKFENDGDFERTMDIVIAMNEHDYSPLDTALGNIDFLFGNNKTRKYIYNEIYKIIVDLRENISQKSYHFRLYKNAKNGNLPEMMNFIDELDKVIMSRETQILTDDEGQTCESSYHYNKVVKKLGDELNGNYYDIMYPNKKEV